MLAFDQRVEDLVLVREVRVERPAREAGALADLLDGGADHAALREHLARGVEDALAGRLTTGRAGRVCSRGTAVGALRARRPVVRSLLALHGLPSVRSIHDRIRYIDVSDTSPYPSLRRRPMQGPCRRRPQPRARASSRARPTETTDVRAPRVLDLPLPLPDRPRVDRGRRRSSPRSRRASPARDPPIRPRSCRTARRPWEPRRRSSRPFRAAPPPRRRRSRWTGPAASRTRTASGATTTRPGRRATRRPRSCARP